MELRVFFGVLCFSLIEQSRNQELLPNDRCNHYPERGSCETNFEVKWYYDRFDHRCRRFFYGGCEGNGNRFDSLEECQQTCHHEKHVDEDDPSKRCFMPHDPGHCAGNFERWHFDANLGQCVCSWWSGCGGNSNSRYYSYQHCMHVCGQYAKSPSPYDYNSDPASTYEHQTPSRPVQIPHKSKMQIDPGLWDIPGAPLDVHHPGEESFVEPYDEPYSIDPMAPREDLWRRKRREKILGEIYETPFLKVRKFKAKKNRRRLRRGIRYEEYAETSAYRPSLNLRPASGSLSQNNKPVRYEEYAETPYSWPSYVEMTTSNSRNQVQTSSRVPQPGQPRDSPRIPQEILNRLIQQYLAKRTQFTQESTTPRVETERPPSQNQPTEVQYTLYRRFPTNSSQLSYAEKRRRWKAETKRRMKAAKIPPRPANIPPQQQPTNRIDDQAPVKKGKYVLTYNPAHRVYSISRQRPRLLGDDQNQRLNDVPTTTSTITTSTRKVTTTRSPTTTTPMQTTTRKSTTTTSQRPVFTTKTTTTTPKPKVIRLPAETVLDPKGSQLTVRVASIKPSSSPIKQIIILDDDYDMSEEEEDDDDFEQEPPPHDAHQPDSRTHYQPSYERPTVQPAPYIPSIHPPYRYNIHPTRPAYVPPPPPTPPPYKPPQYTPTQPPRSNQIVYPVGHGPNERIVPTPRLPITTPRTPEHKKIDDVTNFFAPPPDSREEYDDIGESEEDLFFWKPDYEQRKGLDRVNPNQPPSNQRSHNYDSADFDDDPFKIEVQEVVKR